MQLMTKHPRSYQEIGTALAFDSPAHSLLYFRKRSIEHHKMVRHAVLLLRQKRGVFPLKQILVFEWIFCIEQSRTVDY
jgi:hypothetical protein